MRFALVSLALASGARFASAQVTTGSPVVTTGAPTLSDDQLSCRPIQDIYANGKEMCEFMWDDSFEYIPTTDTERYNDAYTMWFFTDKNPNDEVTQRLIAKNRIPNIEEFGGILQSPQQCYIEYNHKEFASEEPESFTECGPWRKNSCCHEATVENADKINNVYDPEYRWDRCGTLSKECERFFVQEVCFYECDANVGIFRKYPPSVHKKDSNDTNGWQMYKMPIKGDYCDAMFQACRYDKFCSKNQGSFFGECSVTFEPVGVTNNIPGGVVAGIVIGSILGCLLLIFLGVLIDRERRGTPMFGKIETFERHPLNELEKQARATGEQAGARASNDEIVGI